MAASLHEHVLFYVPAASAEQGQIFKINWAGPQALITSIKKHFQLFRILISWWFNVTSKSRFFCILYLDNCQLASSKLKRMAQKNRIFRWETSGNSPDHTKVSFTIQIIQLFNINELRWHSSITTQIFPTGQKRWRRYSHQSAERRGNQKNKKKIRIFEKYSCACWFEIVGWKFPEYKSHFSHL